MSQKTEKVFHLIQDRRVLNLKGVRHLRDQSQGTENLK